MQSSIHANEDPNKRIHSYLWNGSRVCDGRHYFIDEVHRDVTHHPGSLVFLMGQRLCGFALFSYNIRTQKKALILITCLLLTSWAVQLNPNCLLWV